IKRKADRSSSVIVCTSERAISTHAKDIQYIIKFHCKKNGKQLQHHRYKRTAPKRFSKDSDFVCNGEGAENQKIIQHKLNDLTSKSSKIIDSFVNLLYKDEHFNTVLIPTWNFFLTTVVLDNNKIQCNKDKLIQCNKDKLIQCNKDKLIQCNKDKLVTYTIYNIQCNKDKLIQCNKDKLIQCNKDKLIQCNKINLYNIQYTIYNIQYTIYNVIKINLYNYLKTKSKTGRLQLGVTKPFRLQQKMRTEKIAAKRPLTIS
ncbi:hypothetical protein L9F63_014667, partial [Diploptera punctata]